MGNKTEEQKLEEEEQREDIGYRIHRLCKEIGIPNPLEFTISIMAGKDPRLVNTKSEEVQEMVNSLSAKTPTKKQWGDLRGKILDMLDIDPAPLKLSAEAAKQLLEYSFAKKRAEQVDLDNMSDIQPPNELNKKEIDIFHKKFNAEY